MRKPLFLAIAVAAFILLVTPMAEGARAQPPDVSQAIAVQERHTAALLNAPGIVGTGVGLNPQGVPVIRLYVQAPGVGAPASLEGIPVERVITGQIVAQCYQSECDRPVPLGVSTGHPEVTAGTIGARVRDQDGNVYALSNNHVYANNNDASIGDSALQPGAYDGGHDPAQKIGELAAFKPMNFSGGDNDMDAAIASSTTAMLGNVTYSGYSPTSSPVEGSVGLDVKKDGRTTGLTTGQISEVNVTVTVCYQPRGRFMCAKSARFVDQLAVGGGSFSAGGDSGSLVVTESDNHPVGLLFAGSTTRTIANPIQPVLDYFGVEIDDSTGTEPPPTTNPPNASFASTCTELTCEFDASGSTDGDTAIVSYDWDFGDDNSGGGETVNHTYGSDGTYTVTLTVTAEDGESDTTSESLTVSSAGSEPDPDPGDIALSANGYKVRGIHHADLAWSGVTSTQVDIFRDDARIETVDAADGGYTDSIGNRGGGSYMYQVCEAGTTTCSDKVQVEF